MSALVRLAPALLLFAGATPAAEPCGVTDAVLADGFEPGTTLAAYTQPSDATPLALAVLDPPNNTVTGLDRIVLQGSFTGPPNTGIVAADRIAAHSDTRFVTPPIALKPGANQIPVQLHTLDGPGPVVMHTITYTPALAPRARLLPATASAMAPATIAFDVSTNPGEALAITRVRLDTDGNGSTDLDTTSPDTLKATYPQPALIHITGTATLDDTNPNTAPVEVPLDTWFLAQHPQQTRYALCSAHAARGRKHRRRTQGPRRSPARPVRNAVASPRPAIAGRGEQARHHHRRHLRARHR